MQEELSKCNADVNVTSAVEQGLAYHASALRTAADSVIPLSPPSSPPLIPALHQFSASFSDYSPPRLAIMLSVLEGMPRSTRYFCYYF